MFTALAKVTGVAELFTRLLKVVFALLSVTGPVPKGPAVTAPGPPVVLAPWTSTLPPLDCSVNPPLKVLPELLMTSAPLPEVAVSVARISVPPPLSRPERVTVKAGFVMRMLLLPVIVALLESWIALVPKK